MVIVPVPSSSLAPSEAAEVEVAKPSEASDDKKNFSKTGFIVKTSQATNPSWATRRRLEERY